MEAHMGVNSTSVSKSRNIGKYSSTVVLNSFPYPVNGMTFSCASITFDCNPDFIRIFLADFRNCFIDCLVNLLVEAREISYDFTPNLIRAYDGFQFERIRLLLPCFFKQCIWICHCFRSQSQDGLLAKNKRPLTSSLIESRFCSSVAPRASPLWR